MEMWFIDSFVHALLMHTTLHALAIGMHNHISSGFTLSAANKTSVFDSRRLSTQLSRVHPKVLWGKENLPATVVPEVHYGDMAIMMTAMTVPIATHASRTMKLLQLEGRNRKL